MHLQICVLTRRRGFSEKLNYNLCEEMLFYNCRGARCWLRQIGWSPAILCGQPRHRPLRVREIYKITRRDRRPRRSAKIKYLIKTMFFAACAAGQSRTPVPTIFNIASPTKCDPGAAGGVFTGLRACVSASCLADKNDQASRPSEA